MQPDVESIRELAYRLWEQGGRQEGHAQDDWLAAEEELRARAPAGGAASSSKALDESLKESFPASDPPASRSPDNPPANAEAKWAAAAKAKRGKSRFSADH